MVEPSDPNEPPTLVLSDEAPMPSRNEDSTTYAVIVNGEEQYSIWPVHREPPMGWRAAGFTGLKQQCLEYIQEVWVDMRPLGR